MPWSDNLTSQNNRSTELIFFCVCTSWIGSYRENFYDRAKEIHFCGIICLTGCANIVRCFIASTWKYTAWAIKSDNYKPSIDIALEDILMGGYVDGSRFSVYHYRTTRQRPEDRTLCARETIFMPIRIRAHIPFF